MPIESNPIRTAMTDLEAEAQARQIIADFATSYRDPSPVPVVGSAPPVAQPGVPPMSKQATDIGRAAMYCGLATVPPGLIASLILVASEHADPTVIAWICAAPAALAVPVLALSWLFKSAGQALPPEHHHHYRGPVTQTYRTVTNQNRWLGRTTNNL